MFHNLTFFVGHSWTFYCTYLHPMCRLHPMFALLAKKAIQILYCNTVTFQTTTIRATLRSLNWIRIFLIWSAISPKW